MPKHPDHGFICVLGGKKWISEKGNIIQEIRQIFKIPINCVNIIPVQKNGKIRFFKNLILPRKKSRKKGQDFKLLF